MGIQTSSINSGPVAGFKNRIINGNFDIWQRGTSFTGNGYTADRWVSRESGSTHTLTRQAFTPGQTDVPGEPEYFCRVIVSSVAGDSNFVTLAQRIEGVRTFAGQQVTASFWAKADASKPIAVELTQNFGTGGSPSETVLAIGVTKTTLSTSWQKITVTATVPSISGKTIGTNGDNELTWRIYFDAGSDLNARTDSLGQQSGTFDIAQVQIEPGPVATEFERRPIGTELALCQRYFNLVDLGTANTTTNITMRTSAISTVQSFSLAIPKMRTTPTLDLTNLVARTSTGSGGTPTTVTASATARSDSRITIGATGLAAFTTHYVDNGGTIGCSAEL